MNKCVVDACIVIKWVFKETLFEEARDILNRYNQIMAPDIILIECLGAIQSKVHRNEISINDGWETYLTIQKFEDLELVPSQPLLANAYTIANNIGHAIYDCLYLALAEQEDTVAITADRNFYNRARNNSYDHYIALIEDIR